MGMNSMSKVYGSMMGNAAARKKATKAKKVRSRKMQKMGAKWAGASEGGSGGKEC